MSCQQHQTHSQKLCRLVLVAIYRQKRTSDLLPNTSASVYASATPAQSSNLDIGHADCGVARCLSLEQLLLLMSQFCLQDFKIKAQKRLKKAQWCLYRSILLWTPISHIVFLLIEWLGSPFKHCFKHLLSRLVYSCFPGLPSHCWTDPYLTSTPSARSRTGSLLSRWASTETTFSTQASPPCSWWLKWPQSEFPCSL